MSPAIVLAVAEGGGFNPLDISGAGGFLWTLIIFLAALPFMWKIVFSKVTAALVDRDERATEAIRSAQRANEEAERVRAEVEVHLGEAQAEATKLLSAARERAEVRERDIVENAKQEAEAMIASARSAIEAEKEKALSSIRAEVVELSLSAASKVIGRNVSSEDDRRLVEELVGGAARAGSGPAEGAP